MRIALAQMHVLPGQPERNVQTMLRMIGEAKERGAHLVAFPEMCVGGYLVGDAWTDEAFCADLMEYNETLREASDGIAVAYGNVSLDADPNGRVGDDAPHPNTDGRTRTYNAVYVFQDKKPARRRAETAILPAGVQPKTLLPSYRVFDDERYFLSLADVAADYGVPLERLAQPFLIDVDGEEVPVGFELCEDLWCADYRKDGRALNVTRMLVGNGAAYVVNASASPWTHGKNAARDRRVSFLKEDASGAFAPFLYVNAVGAQNNGKNILVFDGGSTAYGAHGRPVRFANASYREELLVVDDEDFARPPQRRFEQSRIAQKLEAILYGIRHVADMTGAPHHPRYVIGLSGGIDSAVVAALLTLAVGQERVLGVNMPTRHNSAATRRAARHVADALGIAYTEIPIQQLVDENTRLLEQSDRADNHRPLTELHKENIQAKIRGTSVLSNLAAQHGALFTCNGNKLEIALGYATLYGDVGGALAPIGDLAKVEVFALARHLNDAVFRREVIPNALFPDAQYRFGDGRIAPTAELKKAQVDPMKFGYHDALLEAFTDYRKKSPQDVLQWFLDGTLERNLGVSAELLERWGVTDAQAFVEDLEWFAAGVQRSVFKRVQGPPIIVTSKSAYGYDIRESILPPHRTRTYERLRKQVLAQRGYAPRVACKVRA